jgi:hypothetical protein
VTVYGGKVKGEGVHLDADGFFVVCCKCGWHSKVEIFHAPDAVVFKCGKCGNYYRIE